MSWRLTTRVNGRVERQTFSDAAAAFAALEERGRDISGGSQRDTIKVANRTYDPVVQVQARVEVRGPRGVTGGVDVRGNGAVEAYTGRFRRELVEAERGESAYAALRRALGSSVSVGP